MEQLLPVGTLVLTAAADACLCKGDVASALIRHARGDCGDLHPNDQPQYDYGFDGGQVAVFSQDTDRNGTSFVVCTNEDRTETEVFTEEEWPGLHAAAEEERADHTTAATYYISIGALDCLSAEEIGDFTRACLWTGVGAPCTCPDCFQAGFSPADFTETRCVEGNHSFWVLTKRDRSEQWVLTCDEHDALFFAFGPSLYSEQYEGYHHEGECTPSGPSDFNMVRVTGSVVTKVGWTVIRECATTFANPRADRSERRLGVPSDGLREIGVFRSHHGLLVLAVEPEQSLVGVHLL